MTAYANNNNADHGKKNYRIELIPVASRSCGSWRFSIERRAFGVQELASRYDDVATKWQQTLTRLGVSSAYLSLANQIIAKLDRKEHSLPIRVLECGAGTADFSRALASTSTKELQISAVDISPAMKNQADLTFTRSGLSLDYRVADIRNLPYADQSKDVVIATHVLEHLAEPSQALFEIQRVLKPGGLIVLCCTKQSLSGRWIQMKWRTHSVKDITVRQWLDQHAFDEIEPLPINRRSLLHNFSVAFTATNSCAANIAA